MHIQTFGQSLPAPTLVCVPGLLGGAEDFAGMIETWKQHFHILILDPNFDRREEGLNSLSQKTLEEISFTSSVLDIAEALENLKIDKVFLAGISLGGKIVFDFASRYPEKLLGAVITDVSPGPFADSELFQFVDVTVTNAPLHLPWPEMKKYLNEHISDRNLRTLIQTQIHYPEAKPPAKWKAGMANFENMLIRQSINDQYEDLRKVDDQLAQNHHWLHVLKARALSGISPTDAAKLGEFKSVKIHTVEDASHFLHVTHKKLIEDKVIGLLQP